jgi:hypothetical protein
MINNDKMVIEFAGYISGDPASFRFIYVGYDNYPGMINGKQLRAMPASVQSEYILESFSIAVEDAEKLVLDFVSVYPPLRDIYK